VTQGQDGNCEFIIMQVVDPTTKDMTQFWIGDISVLKPVKDEATSSVLDPRLLPRECREAVRLM
jgi:hypothetical protein